MLEAADGGLFAFCRAGRLRPTLYSVHYDGRRRQASVTAP